MLNSEVTSLNLGSVYKRKFSFYYVFIIKFADKKNDSFIAVNRFFLNFTLYYARSRVEVENEVLRHSFSYLTLNSALRVEWWWDTRAKN